MQNATYRHKPKVVEGVKVEDVLAAVSNGLGEEMPHWIRDAVASGKLEIHALRNCVVAYPLANVPRAGGRLDMLLHDPVEHTINICPFSTFEDLYEPLGA